MPFASFRAAGWAAPALQLLVACADSSDGGGALALSAGDRMDSGGVAMSDAGAPVTIAPSATPTSAVAPSPAAPAASRAGDAGPSRSPTPVAEDEVHVPVAPLPDGAGLADAGVDPPLTDAGHDEPLDGAGSSSHPENVDGAAFEAGALAPAFAIELVFEDGALIADAVLESFLAAKARWERTIVGDVADVVVSQKASCDGHDLPERVDDIVVYVKVSDLDGPEGLLGSAGPCAVRSREPRLPFAAVLELDAADVEAFAAAGRLEEVVLHEMGHALGFGSLWDEFGLLDELSDGTGEADTAFNGERARAAFEQLTAGAYEGNIVPVENVGSLGEINGHWRESVLGNELMTTRMGSSAALLSSVTIAALQDMGYRVDATQADEYVWPAEDPAFALFARGSASPAANTTHTDRVLRPRFELDDSGRLRSFRAR